ncbi:MAG: restriction endonuclease subunit S [Prevotella stercorea]|nr:restriction endonuclease subunit S [Leyella stercorea]
MFDLYSGNTPSRLNKEHFKGTVNWISSGELKEHYLSSSKEQISEEAAKNLKLLPVGTFVIAIYGLEAEGVRGTGSITQEPSTISQACMSFIPKGVIENEFLYSWYKKHGNVIGIRYAQGTKQQNLSYDILEKFRIAYPNTKEQEKLNKFISLLDKRIATQNKIIEDLKKLKSAIIEKLYSEIQGKEYSYRQLFEIINERNNRLEFSNVLSASQERGMVSREDLNLDIKFERSNINTYKIVRNGDYVIHLRSFQGGFAFSDIVGVCSPAYTIMRPKDLLEYGYLSYYFTSRQFIKSLVIVTYGIRDGRSINVDEWFDMKIVIPTKEQQRHIVRTIKVFENKIENEEMYASCLLKQKQHLLRQMFI